MKSPAPAGHAPDPAALGWLVARGSLGGGVMAEVAKIKGERVSEPKVPLERWAATRYDPPPSAWVLRKWVRRGEIVPMPELVGKTYYVEATARRVCADAPSLVDRLRTA